MTRIAFSCIKVSKPLESYFRGVSRPKNYFVYFVYFVVTLREVNEQKCQTLLYRINCI